MLRFADVVLRFLFVLSKLLSKLYVCVLLFVLVTLLHQSRCAAFSRHPLCLHVIQLS